MCVIVIAGRRVNCSTMDAIRGGLWSAAAAAGGGSAAAAGCRCCCSMLNTWLIFVVLSFSFHEIKISR